MSSDLLGTILVLSMLALMAARAVPPIAAPLSGKIQLEVPLPLVLRLLDQRINVMAVLAVLVLGSGLLGERWISHELFLFALVAATGILLFPRRYRFTTDGVSANRAAFRTWSEFRGWRHSGNVIRLEGTERLSSLSLYVSAGDSDAVKQLIGRYLPRLAAQRQGPRERSGRSVQKFARMKGSAK
jgi:hypothetical protein